MKQPDPVAPALRKSHGKAALRTGVIALFPHVPEREDVDRAFDTAVGPAKREEAFRDGRIRRLADPDGHPRPSA